MPNNIRWEILTDPGTELMLGDRVMRFVGYDDAIIDTITSSDPMDVYSGLRAGFVVDEETIFGFLAEYQTSWGGAVVYRHRSDSPNQVAQAIPVPVLPPNDLIWSPAGGLNAYQYFVAPPQFVAGPFGVDQDVGQVDEEIEALFEAEFDKIKAQQQALYYRILGPNEIIKPGDFRARTKYLLMSTQVPIKSIAHEFTGKTVDEYIEGYSMHGWNIWRRCSQAESRRLPMNPYFSTPLPLP